jgi:hypothetical protein
VPKRKRPRLIDCTFCGDEQVRSSDEDVFPRWLARKLAYLAEQHHLGTKASYTNYSYERLADLGTERTTGETLVGDIPTAFHLPDVCVVCNGGWMGHLEETARPLMVGLLTGEQKPLAPFDQFVLAMWTVKTCVTYDAARKTRLIPEEFGSRHLYQLGYPLPGAQVNIGHDPAHVPMGELLHGRRPLNGRSMASRRGIAVDMEAVQFSFQFDCLILQATINYGLDLVHHPEWVVTVPAKPPYLHPLWPPGDRFLWPSDAALIKG